MVGTLNVTLVTPLTSTIGVAMTTPCGVCANGMAMEPFGSIPCTGNTVPGGKMVPGGGTPLERIWFAANACA